MANYAGNIIGGAGTGAAMGATVGGPWGAVIGGVAGGLTGLFSSIAQSSDEEEKKKAIEKAAKAYGTSINDMKTMFDNWYRDNGSIGRESDITSYRNIIDNYDPNEFVYDIDEAEAERLKSGYNVDDYYNPNKEAIINATASTLQANAAGAGLGRGTGMAHNVATGVANKNEEMYRDALQAMNQDRQFAYNLWNAKIQQGQNRLNALKNATDTQLSMYGSLAQDYQNWNQNKLAQELAFEQQKAENEYQKSLALASI